MTSRIVAPNIHDREGSSERKIMECAGTALRGWLLALVLSASATGCAHCRLPAIDPSGERLFLPCPNSTTLAAPCFPKPAYTTPAQPPKCPLGTPPLAGASVATAGPVAAAVGAPVRTDRVVLTPSRIIAPVGSEVVLTCGICGADGYFQTGKPIEWMLSQDSVGQFVQVGEGGCHYYNALLHRTPKKNGTNFALGYTSHKALQITKGTANPADDVQVASGQTWISVSSASEGTSHVTAFAPKSAAWDQRKQSATIYWVDAQWVLPPPAVARAGQKQTLATTVSRPRGEPIAGWIVRYEVTGGPPAGFAPTGAPAIEVQTDATGLAAAEIIPSTNQPGVTQVRVQIIRPGDRASERMAVGSGFTSVNWSAPGLAVRVAGPQTAGVGQTAAYRVEVTNPGDMAAKDVTASDVLPPGLVYVSSNPSGQIFGNRIEWRLGDIPGQTTRVIEINVRADGRGEVQHCVKARTADGLTSEGCAATRLFAPSLKVSLTGPQQATLGEQAPFRVEITNVGEKPLTNVTLNDAYEAGLQHAGGGASPLVNVLGTLAPGETKRVQITFNCVAPGRPCHTLDVSADGEPTARNRACVNVVPGAGAAPALGGGPGAAVPPAVPRGGQPRLQVKLTGDRQSHVGDVVAYTIEVSNAGDAPLADVKVAFGYPAAIIPREADAGKTRHIQGEFSWLLDRLNAGERRQLRVRCECLRQDPLATSRVSVTSAQGMTVEDQIRTEILPAVGRGPEGEAGGPPLGGEAEAPGGELKVSLSNLTNPVRVGQRIEYVVTLTNDRNVSDKNVVLSVALPEGLKLADPISGPVGTRVIGADGRSLEYKAIAEMRAGETVPNNVVGAYKFHATATRAGEFRTRVEVRSQRSPQGVVAEAQTTVVGQ